MNPTWKAAVGVILIFILGWAGGVVSTLIVAKHRVQALQRNPDALAIVLERQTARDLGLDTDKKQQLHAVFVQYIQQRLELQKQIQPQVHSLNAQTLTQIDALLTPDQQQKFHDNLVLFKERYGRNPFSVGTGEKSTPPVSSDSVTNASPAGGASYSK